MMLDSQCSQCQFWRPAGPSAKDRRGPVLLDGQGAEPQMGECRRRPLQLAVSVLVGVNPQGGVVNNVDVRGFYPPAREDCGSCGEFEPRLSVNGVAT